MATNVCRRLAGFSPRRSLTPGAVVLLSIALVVAGCSSQKKTRSVRVPVKVAHAEEQSMPYALTSVGTVEALRTAAVGSQVGGVITRVAFREGDVVGKGQVLIQLDPRPFHAALEQARATLQRDRAQAEAARLDAERSLSLYQANVLSQAEWDQKRSANEASAATVRADSASVMNASLAFQYATIRSPIAGRTGRLNVNVGDYVKAATSDPLVTVIQPDPIRVRFTIPERDVPALQRYLHAHPKVEITSAGGGEPVLGSLTFVDNAVDQVSGTLLLKGEFPNRDGRLVPGQFVDVKLVLYIAPRAIVVPSLAVSTGQQGAFVYIVNPDSTVTTRPVQVDRTVDELTIVSSGLKPGESVVTDGQLRLSPGAKVVIKKPTPQGAAADAAPTGERADR
ncbi:MAG TPA: efflux RND transporter periplasmic adaptor subunit [Candidatus Eisenbacteria bacterium]|nr:efflux RND transporter periplasmic adaptor subunit [Candidatus Eisenbacteria bacterium]